MITRPPARIHPGMVLTLEIKGKVVTHRVVSIEPDGTPVTKGDANTYADDWSGLDVHVVGLYRGKLPWIGRGLEGMKTGAWFTDLETVDASVTSSAPAP